VPAMTPITDTPQVRTLLLTDLVDSTSLVERIGDQAAADLFRAHDRMVLELQQRWRGRLIDRSDGLLLIFERPIDGLGFALDYVRGLRDLGREHKQPLQARAGLHVGEVLVWENSADAIRVGAKSLEVEGLAKPLAGRLMSLARPGQILLSATAEPLAHRAARELGERGELLVWKSYGRWRFKGVPEGQEVYEVGEPGLAPLRMPAHTPKAWRDLPLWRRPAALAAEAMVLAAMLVGGWFITQPKPAIAFGERDWVVVGDVRNLTGDARLDDSLEQAFRISLEQSRYVNLISDLKMRETMQRMQRKPETQIDRAIGSEIAMRDGARALLLPTVAEVGGRLRVSAEVIDPRTQTTVYAISADGKGIESALASIDDVTGQLREKLGEAMQNVQKTSVLLPNVSTPSLDALKAFALARHVVNTTEDKKAAIGLYMHALELDPDFALVYADIAKLHASRSEAAQAKVQWMLALAKPGRLSPQEKMRIQLWLGQYDAPGPYLQQVDQYLTLYPDDFDVIARAATNICHMRNDFAGAQRLVKRTLVPAANNQGDHQYGLGIFLLGQERYAESLVAFRKSRELGFTGWGTYYAYLFDVQGQPAQADKVYAESNNAQDGRKAEFEVVTAIGRGQWPHARAAARDMLATATAGKDSLEILRAHAAMASVAVVTGDAEAGKQVRGLLAAISADGADADALYAPASIDLRLVAALLAARLDDAALLQVALQQAEGQAVLKEYPFVGQLQQVVLAEQERLQGKPQAAVARLQPLVKQETALVVVHWALMRAQLAAGNETAASVQSRWLATHRGRAYTEATSTEVLYFFNVAVSAEALKSRAASRPLAGQ
jgi:putative peptide modification system cyclase